MTLLDARGITKRFGGLVAVSSIDLTVEAGAIVSVIGPNGAGKTTLFNVLTGVYDADQGEVLFDQRPITGRRPDQIASLGMARTFQNIRLFGSMTVVENILVGMHTRLRQNPVEAAIRTPKFLTEEKAAVAKASQLMKFVGLENVDNELARSLPYGLQRRIEIARALATDPKLLLLDEPTAGMNPVETDEATRLIRRLRDDLRITVLLIEHQMRVVMGISERITVMDFGEKIAEGPPQEIRADKKVIEAYLGRGAAERAAVEA